MTYPNPHQEWNPQPPGRELAFSGDVVPAPLPPTLALPVPMAPLPPVPVPMLVPQKSAGAAVVLELVLGLFGIFGIGNLYAGRVAAGILLMVSFGDCSGSTSS